MHLKLSSAKFEHAKMLTTGIPITVYVETASTYAWPLHVYSEIQVNFILQTMNTALLPDSDATIL